MRRADTERVSTEEIIKTAGVETTERKILGRLQKRDLDRALAKLPEEQRSVILLVVLEEMKYDEVADLLHIPLGTVRSRLSRGREALRKMMDEPERRS